MRKGTPTDSLKIFPSADERLSNDRIGMAGYEGVENQTQGETFGWIEHVAEQSLNIRRHRGTERATIFLFGTNLKKRKIESSLYIYIYIFFCTVPRSSEVFF